MPKQKDLKRVVRIRMQKTGESYTAARLHVANKRKTSAPASSENPPDYAALAGQSDEVVRKKTGRNWTQWVTTLDAFGAAEMAHGRIAEHVHSLGVSGWWSQSVTVGYERIRGLRQIGQRRSGSWEASKSRTFAVPIRTLWDAFNNARQRRKWMPGVSLKVRKATENKSMRITWPDDTSVEVGFYVKGPTKSQVAVQHTKLASKEDVERRKDYWTERFDALRDLLKV